MLELKRGTDQVVKVPGLRTNEDNPMYLNDAAVTGTLYDPKGKVVRGYQGFTLTYVAASNGDYEWQLDGATFLPPTSTLYKLEVVAVQDQWNFRSVYPCSVID